MPASLAEWSKAADLSSAIERCVSSNLTARMYISLIIFWFFHLCCVQILSGLMARNLNMGLGSSSGLGWTRKFHVFTIDIIS